MVASADSLPYVTEALLRDEDRLVSLRTRPISDSARGSLCATGVGATSGGGGAGGRAGACGTSLGTPRAAPAAVESGGSAVAESVVSEIQPKQLGVTGIELKHESPAWAARRAPQVTVITAVRGDHQHIVSTLDSLARSRLRDFELVVVDGGSSDDTRGVVEEWMVGHARIAARLVATGESRLGAVRNIGLDLARSPSCLILDAGQQLYARCLDVLTATLEAMPDVAFAYPILEVTGAPKSFADAGGDYLLSFLGWDPGRLRRGNDVHAPVLIGTARLRRLGGYTTDPRLDGFEDYDLWCRMADRGWRGQLVPQLLARRAESGSSPTLASICPSPSQATKALVERAPRLLSSALATT